MEEQIKTAEEYFSDWKNTRRTQEYMKKEDKTLVRLIYLSKDMDFLVEGQSDPLKVKEGNLLVCYREAKDGKPGEYSFEPASDFFNTYEITPAQREKNMARMKELGGPVRFLPDPMESILNYSSISFKSKIEERAIKEETTLQRELSEEKSDADANTSEWWNRDKSVREHQNTPAILKRGDEDTSSWIVPGSLHRENSEMGTKSPAWSHRGEELEVSKRSSQFSEKIKEKGERMESELHGEKVGQTLSSKKNTHGFAP